MSLESLKRAVQALALAGPEQRALFPPFVCVADELALDFDAANRALLERNFSHSQATALRELDEYLDSVSGPADAEVWADATLDSHPAWVRIRALAAATLAAFVWPQVVPPRNGATYVSANAVSVGAALGNAAVELHDSEVASLTTAGGDVVLVLAPAYVHRSTGRPGIDPGTGWTGTARFEFGSGVIAARPVELPCELATGSLRLGSRELDNCLPVPLWEAGCVELEAVTLFGERLAIQGRSLRLTLLGEEAFVESFPGSQS